MSSNNFVVRKGDVVWAPYRSCPPWPALIRNVYPKKVTYVFFPLPPPETLEGSKKTVATFSCLTKAVRLLRVDDVLPSHPGNDLKEAFDAAKMYLKTRELSGGDNMENSVPVSSNAAKVEHNKPAFSSDDAFSDVSEKKLVSKHFQNGSRIEPKHPSSSNEEASWVKREAPGPMLHNGDKGVTDEQVEEDSEASPEETSKRLSKRKSQPPNVSLLKRSQPVGKPTRLAKRTRKNSSPPKAFAADSTTHLDTSPPPDSLSDTVFRDARNILERVWTTDLVQNYVTPPRSSLRLETHTAGLLTDHETDSLVDLIWFCVREREQQSYILPAVHLVLNVLLPEVLIQSLMKARCITREVAERIVLNTSSECSASSSSSTSSELNCSQSPKNASNNGSSSTKGGSLDELARIACEERESITE